MSRSYKHNPISGITICHSEKEDKKIWHSRLRSWVRTKMHSVYPEDYEDISYKEVSNPWIMGKDGKQYVNPNEFPEVLRK